MLVQVSSDETTAFDEDHDLCAHASKSAHGDFKDNAADKASASGRICSSLFKIR